jgi:transposase
MRILKTKPHLSDSELFSLLNSQKEIRAYKDWQIIYSVQINIGKRAEEIAQILGVSKSKVYYVIQCYNKHGINWRTYDNWGGRREERCNLSLEEEKSLLNELEADALSGNILIYKHVKSKVEAKVGNKVSDDYIWDLFKRHNWKKKVPRQSHPKSDKSSQEEFKKNSKKYWFPSL